MFAHTQISNSFDQDEQHIVISIFGIIKATITALMIMPDQQAALNDNYLEFSLYHNPHFGNTTNWSTVKPNPHIIGVDHGHIKVMLLPNSHRKLYL